MKKLQVGDVFAVKKGMFIYVNMPSRFMYLYDSKGNYLSDIPIHSLVKVGRIYKSANGFEILRSLMFAGEYVVTKALMDGGGTGHGPHDVYPNGWHITAKKLNDDGRFDPDGIEIEFYQSGLFTAVNKKIPVLRVLKRTLIFA